MSSIKLNSSGGGSVSLSAASTSTDVTVKFPSGNSTIGQALVASNTSGELNWENVPTDSSTAVFQGFVAPVSGLIGPDITQNYASAAQTLELDYSISGQADFDTHNAYDPNNHFYVVPTDGVYYMELHIMFYPSTAHGTTSGRITAGKIKVNNPNGTPKYSFLDTTELSNTFTANSFPSVHVSGLAELTANDRILFQTGGVLDANNPDAILTNFVGSSVTMGQITRIRG